MLHIPMQPVAIQAESTRALILENGTFNREGVEPFLRPHRDIEIVGVCGDVASAAAAANRYLPHVVIVNLNDELDAIRALRELRKRAPNARTLVMLGQNEPTNTRAARNSGADELLFGNQRPAAVVTSVRRLGDAAHQDSKEP